MVKEVFQGQGLPAETFIPRGMQGYAPDLAESQKFDVAQARATLASAGVTAGQLNGVKLSYDRSSDFSKATATFVHDQLKTNLGVNIALDPLDTNTLNSRLASGNFEMAGPLGWTADYPDPADWFSIFLTTNSNNFSLYQNGRYDSLVNVAATDVEAWDCVGASGGLMLLAFAFGAGNIITMCAITLLMVVEVSPWGSVVVKLAGYGVIGLGVLVMAGPITPPVWWPS